VRVQSRVAAETESRHEARCAGQLEIPHLQFQRNGKLRPVVDEDANFATIYAGRRRRRNKYVNPDRLISAVSHNEGKCVALLICIAVNARD
jgi:hypothetical protein